MLVFFDYIYHDYIHDFVFDDGHIQNIYVLYKDKKRIACNKLQVIKQFEQTGSHANRYDVTILVNGLPLVQVELKKLRLLRGYFIQPVYREVDRSQVTQQPMFHLQLHGRPQTRNRDEHRSAI